MGLKNDRDHRRGPMVKKEISHLLEVQQKDKRQTVPTCTHLNEMPSSDTNANQIFCSLFFLCFQSDSGHSP